MKNYGCRLTVCTIGAILLGQLLDSFVFVAVLYWGDPQKMAVLNAEYLPRILLSLWISILAAIYLSRIDKEIPGDSRRALDIVLAFFGSYGKTKLLEQNLLESEQRYRTIIQNASDMILVTDANGIIVDANKAAQEMLSAKTMFDLIGCNLDDFLLGPDTLSHLMHEDESVMHLTLPDSSRELELSMSRITVDGTPALVFIGRDITERERLAKERELLRTESAHRQRLEAIGRLAGGIAHDFNNYIHAILGHVDVITLLYPPDNPEVTDHLQKISGIAEQAGHLTSQLLGFARKGKYRVTDVNIHETIESSLALLGPNKRQVEISFRTIPGMPTVRADSLQLQQVLLNLMLNAIDAMEQNEGEQRLTLFAGPATEAPLPFSPPADHPGARPEDYIFIQVADNGCGMDHATIEKAFEPFFTTKPVGRGTGMGLAMVYGTVSHHQGWIQLESTPGAGSNFCIFLPCSGPADSQEKP